MRLKVSEKFAKQRIDLWLSESTPYSRSQIQSQIKKGNITVNGGNISTSYKIKTDDIVELFIPEKKDNVLQAEDIPLEVLYEDKDLVVINKPAGMVVHPAPGHYTKTVVNAILYHCKDFQVTDSEENHMRPGIVHRLDKDTSGIIVIGKNDLALKNLKKQFKSRTTRKEYLAITKGLVAPPSGRIETLIGRSHSNRKKMSPTPPSGGREAITNYKCEKQFSQYALVRFHIETGRTHQIRVHSAYIGHPILGDSLYGHRNTIINNKHIPRQMLHAAYLEIDHPTTGERIQFTSEMPNDMQEILQSLQ
jgi:23S rRNA pseudouridine1911/1915/1917 synthase